MKKPITKKPTTENRVVTSANNLHLTDRIDAFVRSMCYNNADDMSVWFGYDDLNEPMYFHIDLDSIVENTIPTRYMVTVTGIYSDITVTATLYEYKENAVGYLFDIM